MPGPADVATDPGRLPPISDDDLAAQALAADPDEEAAPDAVSLWDLAELSGVSMLPAWYMPSPMRRTRPLRGWRRRVVFLIIVSFLAIAAAGLCSTYGEVVLA